MQMNTVVPCLCCMIDSLTSTENVCMIFLLLFLSVRTFLGMEVSTAHTQLLELVRVVDRTMKDFRLDTFYKVTVL